MPGGAESYLDPILNTMYYVLISQFSPWVLGFVVGAFQGLNCILVYYISGYVVTEEPTITRRGIQVAICIVAVMGPDFISELGNTMGDTLLSVLVLGGLLLICRFLGSPSPRHIKPWHLLIAGGVLIGIASGLKFTNGVYALGLLLGAGLLYGRLRTPRLRELSVLVFCGLVIGFVLADGWYAVLLLSHFGNPVFPFFNNIFHSSAASFGSFSNETYLPRTPAEWLFFPFFFSLGQKLMEIPLRNYSFSAIYLLVTVLALKSLMGRRRGSIVPSGNYEIETLLISWFVISFIIWEVAFSYYRYLAPLEVMAPLVIYIVIRRLEWTPRAGILLVVYAFLIISMVSSPGGWGRGAWSGSYFGVNTKLLRDTITRQHSLILLAPNKPEGFVVPFLPNDATAALVENVVLPSNWSEILRHKIASSNAVYLIASPDAVTVTMYKMSLGVVVETSGCNNILSPSVAQVIGSMVICPVFEYDSAEGRSIVQKVAAQQEALIRTRERQLAEEWTNLEAAAARYLGAGGTMTDMYPLYLEEHGFLSPELGGYGRNQANFNWTREGGWMGSWDGNTGLGIVGTGQSVASLISKERPSASEIYFPYPHVLYGKPSPSASGLLLIILDPGALKTVKGP